MNSRIFFGFILLSLMFIQINGDICRCRCCTGKPCNLNILSGTFNVDRCWYNGGRECLDRCLREYPSQCASDGSTAIPFCRASLNFSIINSLFITLFLFIYQLFIR